MYAVIQTGGKQYKVNEGALLKVEKLEGEVGQTIDLSEVLMIGGNGAPKIGTPQVDGATVSIEIRRQAKDRKVMVYKKKRRKGYEVKRGHRQLFTEIKITKINA